jgi:hypothetical protein
MNQIKRGKRTHLLILNTWTAMQEKFFDVKKAAKNFGCLYIN